jgi:hypothetical protein
VDTLSNATVGAGMIQKDLSRHLVEAAVNVTGAWEADAREVTAQERIARNGHRPAILLIPDSVAGVVERALFERGLQTLVLRENEMSSDVLTSLLSHLWSAAFVVLVVATKVSSGLIRTLEAVAVSPVDFTEFAPNLRRDELLEQILWHAESLRVRPPALFPGEDD